MSQVAAETYGEVLLREGLGVSEVAALRRRAFASREEHDAFERFSDSVKSKDDPRHKIIRAICHWMEGAAAEAVELMGGGDGDAVSCYVLADSLLAVGRTAEAIEILKSAVSSMGGGEGYALLARALRKAGDYEGARDAVEKGLKGASDCASLLTEAGILHDVDGLREESVAKYEKAIQVDGACVDALFRLAFVSDLYGDTERALELYRRCVQTKPVRVNALVNLGLLYEEVGLQEEAVKCFRLAGRCDPTNPKVQLCLRDARASEDMYFDEEQQKRRERRNKILETPISDFELSVRSRNCLEKMDVTTLGDLTRISELELLSFKNFGETSLEEIKRMMTSRGLRLGQALEEEEGKVGAPSSTTILDVIETPTIITQSVDELNLSVRCRHCMAMLGIKTIADLTAMSEKELMSAKNFGSTSLAEVKKKLAVHGLTLADDE